MDDASCSECIGESGAIVALSRKKTFMAINVVINAKTIPTYTPMTNTLPPVSKVTQSDV
jgi:hypothetical protein